MTKHSEALDIVIGNFADTVRESRFSAQAVRSVLRGILDEFQESPQQLGPDGLQPFLAKSRSSFDVDSWSEQIWLTRISSIFTKANGWEGEAEGDFSTSVKTLDTNVSVPTLSFYSEIYRWSHELGIGLIIRRAQYNTTVDVYSDMPLSEAVDWASDYVENPDPLVGQIIKLTSDGISIMNLEPEHLQEFESDVEAATEWLAGVSDSSIREQLAKAGLPSRAGMLLEGPPGAGKTTLARREAIRHAGDATIVYPEAGLAPDQIFDFAERYDPVLIVLEDVESFFGERGAYSFSEFLNRLDGAAHDSALMVIATTNDSSKFDPAILRPGRLERKVVITAPRENFALALIEQRLPHFSLRFADDVAAELVKSARLAKTALTPAIVDGFARGVILSRFDENQALEYAKTFEVKNEGESYI